MLATHLLREVVGNLAPAILDQHVVAGLHQAAGHWPAHIADANEADPRLICRDLWHHSAALVWSISRNTSEAVLNASRQAGIPQ